jgi:hypothetical protein
MLRPEEERAKQILESYFHQVSMNVEISEGANPPDLVAIYQEKKIPLEVTRAVNICLRNDHIENRVSQDNSICDICDSMNDELGKKIPMGKTLLLIINGPARDNSKFKKSLRKLILSILNDENRFDSLHYQPMRTTIEYVPIELKLLNTVKHKRISAIVSNKNGVSDLVYECSLVLSARIKDKEVKTHSINGEKWLVIINELVIASSDHYVEAFSEVAIAHSFTKIFLIDGNKVIELYSAS